MDSDRLSVAVVEFVIIDVVCCFLQNKKEEEEEETGKGNERHILGYNINITDRFIKIDSPISISKERIY